MPSEAMTLWFKSRKPAQIEGLQLTLRPHRLVRNIPLSCQQGQAEVFFAKAQDGSSYILKHFYDSKRPETTYLNAIRSLLPQHKAFRCGTERIVLSKRSLIKTPGGFATQQLAAYLENSLLMPQIDGMDWAGFISRIRSRSTVLSPTQRLNLCSNLARIVKLMEEHQISHRDLSGGNVFINPQTLDISLIDLDSLHHPSLKMPKTTTIGSEGYTAPFASPKNPAATFVPYADRFALAIFCVEFLILDSNSPCCHEGGIFEQKELNKRQGKTLSHVESRLKRDFPDVLSRFKVALSSRCYKDCPSPQEWVFTGPISISLPAPKTIHMPQIPPVHFKHKKIPIVTLPGNPWNNLKGELKHGTLAQSVIQLRSPDSKSMRPLGLDSTTPIYLQSVANPMVKPMGQGIRTLLKKGLGIFFLAILALWKKTI